MKELTIDKTKIDETGIRFPDVPTNNISGSSEQISTFLELPKQETKVKKGNDFNISKQCKIVQGNKIQNTTSEINGWKNIKSEWSFHEVYLQYLFQMFFS